MNKKAGLVGLVVLMVGLGWWGFGGGQGGGLGKDSMSGAEEQKELVKIEVGGKKLEVEVVRSPGELNKGLGERDEIGSEGMLFVLPVRQRTMFWMKGMRFDLDFVWIDCGEESGLDARQVESEQSVSGEKNVRCRVVQVDENIRAPINNNGEMEYVNPAVVVTHVLEVASGWVGENGVEAEDEVILGG